MVDIDQNKHTHIIENIGNNQLKLFLTKAGIYDKVDLSKNNYNQIKEEEHKLIKKVINKEITLKEAYSKGLNESIDYSFFFDYLYKIDGEGLKNGFKSSLQFKIRVSSYKDIIIPSKTPLSSFGGRYIIGILNSKHILTEVIFVNLNSLKMYLTYFHKDTTQDKAQGILSREFSFDKRKKDTHIQLDLKSTFVEKHIRFKKNFIDNYPYYDYRRGKNYFYDVSKGIKLNLERKKVYIFTLYREKKVNDFGPYNALVLGLIDKDNNILKVSFNIKEINVKNILRLEDSIRVKTLYKITKIGGVINFIAQG